MFFRICFVADQFRNARKAQARQEREFVPPLPIALRFVRNA